jgi:hypothetical protein
MAGYDPTQAISVPGRFVLGPTQGGMSTGTYPYGAATKIGMCSKIKLVLEQEYFFGHSEALGRNKASAYGGRYAAALAAVVEQFDKDVLSLLYASSAVSAGGYQGANVLSLPLPGRNQTPGAILPNASALLYAADDYLNHPSLIVYAPIFIRPSAKVEHDLDLKPFETLLLVLCGLDATQRDFAFDLLGNLST